MFNAFTWFEFFTVIAVALIAYYLVSVVVFFHREIKNRFVSSPGSANKTSAPEKRSEHGLIERIQPAEIPLTDRRSSLSTSEEIMFADADEPQDDVQFVQNKPAELAVGIIPDLLEEIKTVINHLSSIDFDSEELTTIFETLLGRYAQLRNTPYQETISVFIHELSKEKLNAVIPLQQVRTWWHTSVINI